MRLYATSYAEGGLIPMSQVQGVIYTESCQTCLVTFAAGNETAYNCDFCRDLYHNVVIQNNTFVNNTDGLTFYE